MIIGESSFSSAREIIGCAGILRTGIRIVSCPRCGRASFDTHGFTERWADRLYAVKDTLEVAIMGCVVNGPGEARHADIGITGAGDYVLIFRRGEVTRKVTGDEVDVAFAEELRNALAEKSSDRG